MNLKESFHYQNYLDDLFNSAQMYLQDHSNLVKVSQEHLRNKSNPDAADETLDGTKVRVYQQSNDTIVRLLLAVIEEKHDVAIAIGKAKATCSIDIDAEAATNKLRHMATPILYRMGAIKPEERKTRGSGYKFNVNGDQVSYYYDILEKTDVDFDRPQVKRLAKELSKKANEVSDVIDHCMIDTTVEFTPLFNVGDTLEDALETFEGHESYVNHAV